MECQCQKCHSPWVLFAHRCGPITIAAHYHLTFFANSLVALLASVDHLVLIMHVIGAGHSGPKFLEGGFQVKEHLHALPDVTYS